jgi:hypothetical protein
MLAVILAAAATTKIKRAKIRSEAIARGEIPETLARL